ncbi:ferrous iron transport protein A [Natranaerovirga pectinivora]|uniref:Ferrous iron transport protein A n=1 Tax=Natranaerovirga pectinivora TaxID=682400 RepID=A0A4R3MH35_9FIRM|nr:FeoA family protein [Natranaerovirga pectinivora]TCT12989.1 ferrous iron transport protein A [Natranaerovirga pectinivora]
MSLYKFNKKENCIIDELPTNDLLLALGLRKGVTVSVLTRQPFGGPIVVKMNNRSIAIDKNVAEQIMARLVS